MARIDNSSQNSTADSAVEGVQGKKEVAPNTVQSDGAPVEGPPTPTPAEEEQNIITLWIESPNGKFWRVPNMRMEEQVGSLKQLFVEIPALSQYSSYALQVVAPVSSPKKKSKKNTTQAMQELQPLSAYPVLAKGGHVRISPVPYTAASVHTHVQRLRDMLANPLVSFNDVDEVSREEATRSLQALATESTDTEVATEPETETTTIVAEVSNDNTNDDQAKGEPVKDEENDVQAQEAREKHIQEQLEAVSKLASDDCTIPIPVKLTTFYPGQSQVASGLDITSSYTSCEDIMEQEPLPKCIESIEFSAYNPPPRSRELLGDLAYLQVKTLEGSVFHVSATPSGFYINNTTAGKFDPSVAKVHHFSYTLCELVEAISPLFKKTFASLVDILSNRATSIAKCSDLTEFEVGQLFYNDTQGGAYTDGMSQSVSVTTTDVAQWNVKPQASTNDSTESGTQAHTADKHRAELFLTQSLALTSGMAPRDWNEEYQSTLELPMSTLEDRIMRARAVDRIQRDFVSAATSGALDVLNGRINCINPDEPIESHVFVYQNIFYSLASLHDESRGPQDEVNVASYSMSNHDIRALKQVNSYLNMPSSEDDETGKVSKDGIHTLATAVIDYMGRRVIAQGIIPGILQSDPAHSLLYGSVNFGKSIAGSETVHKLLAPIAKHLCIKESPVHPTGLDGDDSNQKKLGFATSDPNDVVTVFGAAESKGIRGADSRLYTLDLIRTTPIDINYYRHTKKIGGKGDLSVIATNTPSSYAAHVRPELVQMYSRYLELEQAEKRKQRVHELLNELIHSKAPKSEDNKGEEENDARPVASQEELKEISQKAMAEFPDLEPTYFDVNTFTSLKLAKTPEQLATDEKLVENLCSFLTNTRIPAFVDEVCRGMKLVADGNSLCEALHRGGINLRYLGEVCDKSIEAEKSTRKIVTKDSEGNAVSSGDAILIPPMPRFFVELCEIEMVSRALKHLVRELFHRLPHLAAAPAPTIVSILNCLFGAKDKNTSRSNETPMFLDSVRLHDQALKSALLRQGSNGLWRQIRERVHKHFRYTLRIWNGGVTGTDADTEESVMHNFKNRAYPLPLLRRVSQLLGIQLATRDYDLSAQSEQDVFVVTDVVNILPRVKSSMPTWVLPEAKELLDYSRAQMSHINGTQSDKAVLSQAFQWANQALQLVAQTVGTAHETAALCSTVVAAVLNEANELEAAIAHERRALTFNDRRGKRDSPDVAYGHMKLSALYRRQGKLDQAVLHVRRALYLFELMAGPSHPEAAALYQQLGMLYATGGVKAITHSLGVLNEALSRCGHNRMQYARCLHSMAQACARAEDFAEAMKFQEVTRNIYKEVLGMDDSRTKDATDWFMVFASKHKEQNKRGGRKTIAAVAATASERVPVTHTNEEEWKAVEPKKSKKKTGGKKGKSKRKK